MILSLLKGMIKHSQSNKFARSLEYLKKEVRDRVYYLHEGKHQSSYKMAFLFLMEVARHVQCTLSRKMAIFLQYIKKVSQLLLCSFVMHNIQIFYEGSVVFVVTCPTLQSSITIKFSYISEYKTKLLLIGSRWLSTVFLCGL